MPKSPSDIFPSPDDLLTLEPEDVAPLLLEYLCQDPQPSLKLYTLLNLGSDMYTYAGTKYQEVFTALAEAWVVLQREGLLALEPNPSSPESFFITKRGRSLQNKADYQAYRKGSLLPSESLAPVLGIQVRSLFLKGDYDTAVFRAFKEVEIRVRQKCGFPDDEIGTLLMRKAFDAGNGPLSDKTRPEAERQATAHFFAGAIGLFKNPSSHRNVSFTAEEAADLIRLANYLVLWVDQISR